MELNPRILIYKKFILDFKFNSNENNYVSLSNLSYLRMRKVSVI